jgi:putative DNA base modification enzyme with NMAD domain
MNGVLVRVGIDSTRKYGGWNAPVDEQTGRFVFVPITDSSYNPADSYILGGKRTYDEVLPFLREFGKDYGQPEHEGFMLPAGLHGEIMHLDPDFKELTYGDDAKRGSCFKGSSEVNFVAFYSSLRSLQTPGKLVYALVGIFFCCWHAPNSRPDSR